MDYLYTDYSPKHILSKDHQWCFRKLYLILAKGIKNEVPLENLLIHFSNLLEKINQSYLSSDLQKKQFWVHYQEIRAFIDDGCFDKVVSLEPLLIYLESKLKIKNRDWEILLPTDKLAKEERFKKSKAYFNFSLELFIPKMRSAFNLASIIRTCECYGLNKVYLGEHCPDLHLIEESKAAMSSYHYLEIEKSKLAALDFLKSYRKEKPTSKIYVIETGGRDIALSNLISPGLIVVGSEKEGVNKEAISHADEVLSIPLRGLKKSLNVGVVTGIVLENFRLKQKPAY